MKHHRADRRPPAAGSVPPGRRRLLAGGLAVLGGAALLAGCGGHEPAPAGQRPPTTAAARCPLTGLAAPGGVVPRRAALAVKVGNDPGAWPQSGLDRADVVIEEPIEGAMTRLIAVYQCHQAPLVGPVRSTRWTDTRVLEQFGGAGFGFAGGTVPEEDMVRSSPLVDLSVSAVPGAYRRVAWRKPPENLYTSTPALWQHMASRVPPRPVFRFGGTPRSGPPVAGARLVFSSSFTVAWRWDPGRRAWVRWVEGRVERAAGGREVLAANVVIERVRTFPGIVEDALGAHGVNSVTVGRGQLTVLSDGHAQAGTWSRAGIDQPAKLSAADGRLLRLAPGVTWVELLPAGGVVTGSLSLVRT